jgi:hypothetical protein
MHVELVKDKEFIIAKLMKKYKFQEESIMDKTLE